MIKKFTYFFLLVSTFALSACHQRVEPHKLNDGNLTCSQIKTEIGMVHKAKNQIDTKTGMSGRNVGLALLFWPGVIINEVQGSDAIKAADRRIEVLHDLYNHKKCGVKSYSAGDKKSSKK